MKQRIWQILKNKYVLATAVFVVWVGFFDQNNIIHLQQLRSELRAVKSERQFYLDEIDKDTHQYLDVVSSEFRLEKFAREKYQVKRENEDIFLIVYE